MRRLKPLIALLCATSLEAGMQPVSVTEGRGRLIGEFVEMRWEEDHFTIKWPGLEKADMHDAIVQVTANGEIQNVAGPQWSRRVRSRALDDELGEGPGLEITCDRADLLEVRVLARLTRDGSGVVFSAQVRNLSPQPVKLERLELLHTDSGLRLGRLGSGDEAPTVYVDSGSQGGTHITRLEKPLACRGICAVYNPVSDLGFTCAYLSFEHDNSVTIAPTDGSITLQATTSTPVELAPGETHGFDGLLVDCRRCPFEGLESYADAVKAVVKPPVPDRLPMGWISWYAYRLTMTEDIVLQNAEVIARHFLKYGVKLIQLDHGWQHRDICGVWTPNEKFPHGLQWLSDKLGDMGFEMGLWTAPSVVSEFAPIVQDSPSALALGPDGRPVVRNDRWTWPPHGKTHEIEPLTPAGEQFLREFAGTINTYGITYLKTDFIGGWGGAARLRRGMGILREHLDPAILIRPCSTALNTQLGFAGEIGIARDIGNASSNWQHMRVFTLEAASKWFMHDKFWANSGGCLMVGDPNEPVGEALGRTTLLALTGGVVLLSDKMPALEEQPDRLRMVPLCLPPSGVPARPVDLFRVGEPGREYPRVWHLHAEKDWGRWEVIGLFNWTDKPIEETIAFSDLGLPAEGEYLVFDFWTQTLAGRFTERLKVTIPAGAGRCLRVMAVPDHPAVVSTDMHVTQGLVDLEKVRWDPRTMTVSGVAVRAPGEESAVYVYLPPGYGLADNDSAEVAGPACGKLTVSFRQAREQWSITFRRDEGTEALPLDPSDSVLVNPMPEWGKR